LSLCNLNMKSIFKADKNRLTIHEYDNEVSLSHTSTIKVTKNDSHRRIENICEKYDKRENFLGFFKEKKYKIHREFITNRYHDSKLYYSQFKPRGETTANLIIVHGWLNSIRFFEMADQFAQHGIAVHLFDLSGFGYSPGVLHNMPFDRLLSDFATILTKVKNKLPLFLYGHSLGALIILVFLLLNPEVEVGGVIVSSPLVTVPADRKLTWFKELFITKVIQTFFGKILINSFMNPTALTKDNFFIRSLCNHRFGLFELGFCNQD